MAHNAAARSHTPTHHHYHLHHHQCTLACVAAATACAPPHSHTGAVHVSAWYGACVCKQAWWPPLHSPAHEGMRGQGTRRGTGMGMGTEGSMARGQEWGRGQGQNEAVAAPSSQRGVSAGGDMYMADVMYSHGAKSGLRFNLQVQVNLQENSGQVQVPLLEAGKPAEQIPRQWGHP
ncbi:hypothetical protein JB92DRAFT_2830281 [Gautieria morchelliformis]|nr:hypothetical protein JB92DRAFT_2830281 [Gautieria morchelliformis]